MAEAVMHELVDLARYPITSPGSPLGIDLSDRLRGTLRERGVCRLEGFLTSSAVQRIVDELSSIEELAYYGLKQATPYFNDVDPRFDADHPRNMTTPRELGLIGAHLIPEESSLKRLYASAELRDFLAAILEERRLYQIEDPYQTVSVTVMPEGAGHNWHFDDSDFTITLMLRKPEWGGDFECVPNLRSPTDENYDGVRAVLRGQRDLVQVVPFEPGTLMIFRGIYSLHRVSPVRGSMARLIAIFSYSTQPGWTGTAYVNEAVYGLRAAARTNPPSADSKIPLSVAD